MGTGLETKDYGAIENISPYTSYIKTILGQVYVTVLSPFNNEPEGVILAGNPRVEKELEGCIVDVWSQKEDMYFRRVNSKNLEIGYIIPYTRTAPMKISEEEELNSMSDEEMRELLKGKFFLLQSKVNKMTSVAPVFRLIQLAKEMEKSVKIINYLEGKLAELQLKEYPQTQEE